jgi:VanZ family protein
MAGIYWLSSQSFVPVPAFFLTYDSFSHALLYAGLTVLLAWALGASGAKERFYLYAFSIAVLYGAIDELHQAFVPRRAASVTDLLADALGAAIGACAFLAGRRFLEKPPGAAVRRRFQNPQTGKCQKGASTGS